MAFETEPNDTDLYADHVGWGDFDPIQVQTTGSDTDWFSFSMYDPGWIDLYFSGMDAAGGWDANRLRIDVFEYDDLASLTPYFTAYAAGDGWVSLIYLIEQGTAYIRITNEFAFQPRADNGYSFWAEPYWYEPPPPALRIEATDAEHYEGNAGTTAFTFTVTRLYDSSGVASVNWRVYDASGSGGTSGSADAADFAGGVLPSGSLTFLAGEDQKTVAVQVAGDTELELDESFRVELYGASGAQLDSAYWAEALIFTDEAPLSGTDADDTLVGSDGADDLLLGAGGNDSLAGLGGSDTLEGGDGIDTARFHGDFAEFDWSFLASADERTLTIERLADPDDSDVLRDVEILAFDDRSVDVEDLVRGEDTLHALFNARTGQTLFTAELEEALAWSADPDIAPLAFEMPAPLATDADVVPVYRVYSSVFDLYLWTARDDIRDLALNEPGIGIEDQGVAFHAWPDAASGGTLPIHMLWDWNPSATYPGTNSPLNILYADEPWLPFLLDGPGNPPVADMGVQFWL